MKENQRIVTVDYEEEMKKSYIDYAMSVIVGRAIPDVRDGLKPVHRRILYTMHKLGNTPDKPYKKSARVVGSVLGLFHPHGDAAVYDAMVRLAQDFSLNIPLVDGHGNFGSIDGDAPAAMRYTEVRLSEAGAELLQDLDKNIVDFQDNFDGTTPEPVVLPAKIPNLLVNGANGIAVGMATNIPPHNLKEVLQGAILLLENPDVPLKTLMKYIKGPDFSTGGIIVNQKDLEKIYETGSGKIKIRAKVEIEEGERGKTNIVVTEIPYSYSGTKTRLIEKIIEAMRNHQLDELSDVRDESSKEGIRIVLEVKKGVDINNFLLKLYKKTPLEDTIPVNMLALVNNRPETLGLKEILKQYILFQKEIYTRKYQYLLEKSLDRQEVLEGLIRAHDVIDLIIEILRGSDTVAQAKACLTQGKTEGIKFKSKKSEKEAQKLRFTEKQAEAILDMKLQRLIGLELAHLMEERDVLQKDIQNYSRILNDDKELTKEIRAYLEKMIKSVNIKRKTQISQVEEEEYVEEKKVEDLYCLIDRFGYIKTVEVASVQKANGDVSQEFKEAFLAKSTDRCCFFTNKGNFYQVKLASLPRVKIKEKGVPISALCGFEKDEEAVKTLILPTKEIQELVFVTANGNCKIVDIGEFETNRKKISATNLQEGDSLLRVIEVTSETEGIIFVSQDKRALCVSLSEIPKQAKNTKGVGVMNLKEGEKLQYAFGKTEEIPQELTEYEKVLRELPCKKRTSRGMRLKQAAEKS